MSENESFNNLSEDENQEQAQLGHERRGSEAALPPAADRKMPRAMISPRETLDFQIRCKGTNRLLELAMPTLGLAVRIRNMGEFENVDALHSRLANEISSFQHEATMLEYDDATILAARYCLCSMVDESILSQMWGAESLWPERPMLSIFHNETWGGEKFFSILDRVLDESHRFVDLLEFLYFCLALGFEGKYHVMHNGKAKLESLMETIYKVLEKHCGEAPDTLLSSDANIYNQRQKMRMQLPVWGVLTAGLVCLVAIHLYFDITLNHEITEISNTIQNALVLGDE